VTCRLEPARHAVRQALIIIYLQGPEADQHPFAGEATRPTDCLWLWAPIGPRAQGPMTKVFSPF